MAAEDEQPTAVATDNPVNSENVTKPTEAQGEEEDSKVSIGDGAARNVSEGKAPAEANGATAGSVEQAVNADGADNEDTVKETKADTVMQEGSAEQAGKAEINDSKTDENKNDIKTDDAGRAKTATKSGYDDLPESSDGPEIRRQVEFYLSDTNLPVDSYLLRITGGHRNEPVPLKVLHQFKRMRHYQPYSAVLEAVKESRVLNVDGNDNITRKVPLSSRFGDDPEANRKLVHSETMPRSVYVKGFGFEPYDPLSLTQMHLETFFEPYGPIRGVRLRRDDRKNFKGSVFVEFENEDIQKQFLALDPKPTWANKDLLIMGKVEYVEGKNSDILEGKVKPRSPNRSRGRNRNRGRGNGKRDWDHPSNTDGGDNWKERRDQDNKERGRGRGRGGGRGRGRGRGGNRGGRDRAQRASPDRSKPYEKRPREDDGADKDHVAKKAKQAAEA